MKNYLSYLVILLLMFSACSQKMDKEIYSSYQKRGNQITNQAQGVLLSNVGSAIQKGGPEYAVEFCNLEVSGIVDSLNRANNCEISRVSEKNRNPENSLKTEADLKIWIAFKNNAQSDTVILVKNNIVYYKRIKTAMPACLKCHGDPQNDINSATLEKLHKLYPDDLATGYQLNDFRGLWKVEFSE